MLSNVLATLSRKSYLFSKKLRLKMKDLVAYKNQNVYLKINIYLNQASNLPFRPVLSLYRNQSTVYEANRWDSFYKIATLD